MLIFGSKLFAMKLVVLLKHSYPALAWRSWKSILLICIIVIIFWNGPGHVQVNMPIISSNCKVWLTSSNIGGVNISGSPFFFSSDWDRFISVSCDNLALMTGINPMVAVGCKSNCVDKSMIEDSKLKYCSGFNCCMSIVPSGIQVLNASFKGIKEENRTSEECNFAFLADDKWLNSTTKDLSYYV